MTRRHKAQKQHSVAQGSVNQAEPVPVVQIQVPQEKTLPFWRRPVDSMQRGVTRLVSSFYNIAALLPLLATVPSAVAAQLQLQFMQGEYNGLNTCLGSSVDCLQGYALNGTELAFRWSRSIASSKGSLVDVFFDRLMKDTVTEARMEQLFTQALEGGAVLADNVCNFPTSMWGSIQAMGQAVGLDQTACNTAKSLFTSLVNEAHDNAASTWVGMLAGGVLGCVALLAILAVIYCCCRGNCHRPACLGGYNNV